MKCQVTFKLMSSCKKMRFSCPSQSMDLPNNKENCKKGDKLQVGKQRWVESVIPSYHQFTLWISHILNPKHRHDLHYIEPFHSCRYCQSMNVSKEIAGKQGRRGLKVVFTSDKKKSGGGAQCTAQCIDPVSATTPTQGIGLTWTNNKPANNI